VDLAHEVGCGDRLQQHLVGADLEYDCLGNDTYRIQLNAYKLQDATEDFEPVAFIYAIDMDDSGSYFENNGSLEIVGVINRGEGIEVDDGFFSQSAEGQKLDALHGLCARFGSGALLFRISSLVQLSDLSYQL